MLYLAPLHFHRACIQETRVAVMGTIQFAGAVHQACAKVVEQFDAAAVPQAKPLSPGEVLGCTSPVIEQMDALVFVADGRFHQEVDPRHQAHEHFSCKFHQLAACRRIVCFRRRTVRFFVLVLYLYLPVIWKMAREDKRTGCDYYSD